MKLLNFFESIWSKLSFDVAIDLGTANTLVFVKGKGIVIREPTVVARNKKTKEILAIGSSAKQMLGKTPKHIETVRPLKGGVVSDFDAAAIMLSYYIKKVHEGPGNFPKVPRPRVVVGIPSGVTEVEQKAVLDAVLSAGARKAYLVSEPMAAAIGSGLFVEGSDGVFIVDIGGGTTEIAAISLGGVVVGRSLRVAGDEMTEAVMSYVRLKYSLLLGETTGEEVKLSLGSAKPLSGDKFFVARGRDLESGLPKSIKLTESEIREAIVPIVMEIVSNIRDVIEETPPELSGNIAVNGIFIAGGGSLLQGIDEVLKESLGVPVTTTKDPQSAVVRGCGKLLENERLLARLSIN